MTSEKSIRVREARAGDTDFILALVPQLLSFGPPPWRDVAQMTETDTLTIARSLRSATDRATVLVAEDRHGQLLGFMHLCAEPDYYTRAECGHIADIVVAPQARGRGVGEALVMHSFEEARRLGFDAMQFNLVFESNPARRLYERLGFQVVGRIPAAIDGEAAIVYWREL